MVKQCLWHCKQTRHLTIAPRVLGAADPRDDKGHGDIQRAEDTDGTREHLFVCPYILRGKKPKYKKRRKML